MLRFQAVYHLNCDLKNDIQERSWGGISRFKVLEQGSASLRPPPIIHYLGELNHAEHSMPHPRSSSRRLASARRKALTPEIIQRDLHDESVLILKRL